ncbi:GNAT family N-acetyltransferase [Streptococcus pneumoniae]|uniref:GNAT family N-acetyltransferase n=1 Tax=Streptococcus pneumoniae TaxID=1313 RepID=UPI000B5967B5|nr:GNAT family N-acetyltransferase [Streptococcus pneumoniae]SNE41691.1 GNAT family acetyltransferase [Streptococcus pneumoniae]SNG23837.1 GNAT family acetyltransferase [Streptococcus pneumoniae]SNN02866.1 GNAT family acetyltransferase [Streptococcus pneumoniae]SNN72478.1 GNAT family acetyltransferase [Streptococcus pneumoniae]
MEYELLIREAEPKDAAELVAFLNRVSLETDFTSLDGDGILLTGEEMEIFLNKQASSDNQITLLAFLNGKIAGIVNITADQRKRVRHIGDLFIVIGKRYWNNGLGSLLLEEAIEWAQASGILRRLQLTVQTRNQAAVHLYQKHGFVIEGSQERGAYIEEEKFIDVYLMGKLIG